MKALRELYKAFKNMGVVENADISSFIFYRIVRYFENENCFTMQCINTNVLFNIGISSLLFDFDILYSLHPVQACFVGIRAAPFFCQNTEFRFNDGGDWHQNCSRYGSYRILYLDRKSRVHFYDKKNSKEHVMNAAEIAGTRELISEFDSVQAYYLGYLSALGMLRSAARKATTLRLVK